ncbi:hypothetical protein ES702_06799 [subsurface metagenome]
MKESGWRVGRYNKVVLTIIAVSLVGLLVRQLPKKVEASPSVDVGVDVISTEYSSLRSSLNVVVTYDQENPLRSLDPSLRELAQKINEAPLPSFDMVLENVLAYKYALGYRVKFATNDFIILERE